MTAVRISLVLSCSSFMMGSVMNVKCTYDVMTQLCHDIKCTNAVVMSIPPSWKILPPDIAFLTSF